jgi:outer membrane biosynthesis protein TonB
LPKNEDGEFELILGNRQLLSVFFIVVILLGVFFTMGYIVGRNSGTLTADVAATPAPDGKPQVVEPPAKIAETAPAAPPPTETAPQQPAKEAEPEPAPAPEQPKHEKVKAEPVRSAASHPSAGQTYLQLAATSKHEADIMVDVLRKKSFKAMAAEIDEKPGTFRVLVGPITDTASNKMRADLQGAGFPGNAAIRRTF